MNLPIRASLPLLAALALAGCGASPTPPESAEGSGAVAPATVRLGRAERAPALGRTELIGTVEAETSAAVSARVMAMVTAVHVSLGDTVAVGQTLLSIDPATSQGQLSQALGARTQAQAALALAERNYQRFQALAETDAASELELDLARSQYEQARGALEQAEGAVAAARSVAGDSRVTAPFAGRVARRFVDVGDLAAPGRPLILLESLRGRRLALAVPESMMSGGRIALGTHIPVLVDARADGGEIDGEVVEVSPGPDPLTHAFTVKLALASGDLAAGSAARALVPTASREAVSVPADAIVDSGGLTLVVVRDDDGRARTRVVTPGARLGEGRIEILSGLDGGESVALGLATAPPSGTPLEPAPESDPGARP